MAGQGSTGNVIAALASVLWIFLLGWLVHLWSIIDAAMFKPRA